MNWHLASMTWQSDVLQRAITYERAVVTPDTFATTFMSAVLSFYAMAVMVQLPHTSLYKVSLLPVVYWTTFRANMTLDFSWNHPGYAYLNQGLALCMLTIAMRSTAWAFSKQPYIRLPICKPGNEVINDDTPTEHGVSIFSAMWNAWDLIVNLRCIGWHGSQKMRTQTPYFQVESRFIFAFLSLCQTSILALACDALCGYVRSLGPDTFGTLEGGTIFDPSLPLPERYIKSSFITTLTGVTAYLVIETVYKLHATLFTILFWQYPWQWPPVFDSPWMSTSLGSLWGRRWHQVFREPFVAVGSKPMAKFLGQAGTIMGAFAVSGILHDVGLRGMGRGGDTLPVTGFFLMQGVGVIMELAWKQATGTRVGGVVGRLWVALWLLIWGNFIVDAWARKGLLGSEFSPEAYRPTLMLLNWISQ